MACNKEEAVLTTALQYLTPYGNYPEFLSGQIKTVEQMSYWAIEKDGVYEKGDLVTRKERDSLNGSSDFKVYYNEDGVHLRTDYYSYERKINSWITDVEDGLMVKSTWVTNDTNRVYIIFGNDEAGHYVSGERYRAGVDTLINRYSFLTNENGVITESKVFNSKGDLTYTYKFTLTENNLTESLKTYSSKDSLISDSKCVYNDKGFSTKVDRLNGIGEIRWTNEFEYTEYDDMENWLSATGVLRNGTLFIITERIYEYY